MLNNAEEIVKLAHDTANALKCSGRFKLTVDDLQSIDKISWLETILSQLEEAVHFAQIEDHPYSVSQNEKGEILQNLIKQFPCSNPENNTQQNYQHFWQLFETRVAQYPSHIAIISQDESSQKIKLTYEQLNQQVNTLAHALIQLKQKHPWSPGTPIGIFFENSPEAVITILAIMKAGLAYVPLTTGIPYVRQKFIIQESKINWLILPDKLKKPEIAQSLLDCYSDLNILSYEQLQTENSNTHNPGLEISSKQLAYIIFSSGSTGTAKGIKVAHRGLCNPLLAVKQFFDIKNNDKVGWHSALTFDASLLDIMTGLGTGASLVIIPQILRTQGEKLTSYLATHKVSIITLVPTILEMLDAKRLPNLRGIISTGEAGKEALFNHWHSVGRARDIGNGYGPSEFSVATSISLYIPGIPPNLGIKPMEGIFWYVLEPSNDENRFPTAPKEVEDNVVGELYLTGAGIALGYINSPDYNLRFRCIPHPTKKGETLLVYQTGDLVAKQDGYLIFKGRVDRQEKLFGVLVCPEAIEQSLCAYQQGNKPFLKHAKVVITKAEEKIDNYHRYVHAFIELVENQEFNIKLVKELVFYLTHFTDSIVFPSRFSLIKEWPLLPNGKIDNALEKLKEKSEATLYLGNIIPVLPTTEIEKNIATIWQDCLQIPANEYQISLDDRFNELGGSSIHTNYMLERVHQAYPAYVKNLAKFNAYPTLRALVYQVQNHLNLNSLTDLVSWRSDNNDNKKILENITENEYYPVVLIHSITGDANVDFKQIREHWKDEFSEYPFLLTIRSPALDNPGYVVSSISQLAADYLNLLDLTMNHYHGPLILIGYSGGGIVAYEMARQLEQKKRLVSVCCLDTKSAEFDQNLSLLQYAKEIYAAMEFVNKKIIGIDQSGILPGDLQEYNKNEQLIVYWQKLLSIITAPIYKNYLGKYISIFNIVHGYLTYKTLPIDNATLIAFSASQLERQSKRLGWPEQLPIDIIEVKASHFDLDDVEIVKQNIIPALKIFLEKAVLTMPFKKTIKELYNLYISKNFITISLLSEDNPTFSFEDTFIPLSLCKYQPNQLNQLGKEKYFNNENNNFCDANYFKNNIVLVEDIFNSCTSEDKEINKILFMGNPGVGKSTFLKYLRFLAAQPSTNKAKPAWLNKFDMVFYIPLRHLELYKSAKVKLPINNYEIARFIYFVLEKENNQSCLPSFKQKEYINRIETILDSKQDKILWLIDGLEEALPILRSTDNIAQLGQKLLKNKFVIVTSRPVVFEACLFKQQVTYEVVGFSDENIESFLSAYLLSKDKSYKKNELLTYLKENLYCWQIAHDPVNLIILASILLQDTNLQIQNSHEFITLTDIYKKLIWHKQERLIESQKISFTNAFNIQETIEELSSKHMCFLENIALTGILHQKNSLSSSILQHYLKETKITDINEQAKFIQQLHNFGILKWYSKQKYQTQCDAYFVHFTFQEFMAARRIANCIQNQSPIDFLQHDNNSLIPIKMLIKEFVSKYKFNVNFSLIWPFVAGLLPPKAFSTFQEWIDGPPYDLRGYYYFSLIAGCLLQLSIKQVIDPEFVEKNSWFQRLFEFTTEELGGTSGYWYFFKNPIPLGKVLTYLEIRRKNDTHLSFPIKLIDFLNIEYREDLINTLLDLDNLGPEIAMLIIRNSVLEQSLPFSVIKNLLQTLSKKEEQHHRVKALLGLNEIDKLIRNFTTLIINTSTHYVSQFRVLFYSICFTLLLDPVEEIRNEALKALYNFRRINLEEISEELTKILSSLKKDPSLQLIRGIERVLLKLDYTTELQEKINLITNILQLTSIQYIIDFPNFLAKLNNNKLINIVINTYFPVIIKDADSNLRKGAFLTLKNFLDKIQLKNLSCTIYDILQNTYELDIKADCLHHLRVMPNLITPEILSLIPALLKEWYNALFNIEVSEKHLKMVHINKSYNFFEFLINFLKNSRDRKVIIKCYSNMQYHQNYAYAICKALINKENISITICVAQIFSESLQNQTMREILEYYANLVQKPAFFKLNFFSFSIDLQYCITKLLGYLNWKNSANDRIWNYLHSKNIMTKIRAIHTLAHHDFPQNISDFSPFLLDCLQHENFCIRISTLTTIGKLIQNLAHDKILSALAILLEDSNHWVRYEAIRLCELLLNLPSNEIINSLINLYFNSNELEWIKNEIIKILYNQKSLLPSEKQNFINNKIFFLVKNWQLDSKGSSKMLKKLFAFLDPNRVMLCFPIVFNELITKLPHILIQREIIILFADSVKQLSKQQFSYWMEIIEKLFTNAFSIPNEYMADLKKIFYDFCSSKNSYHSDGSTASLKLGTVSASPNLELQQLVELLKYVLDMGNKPSFLAEEDPLYLLEKTIKNINPLILIESIDTNPFQVQLVISYIYDEHLSQTFLLNQQQFNKFLSIKFLTTSYTRLTPVEQELIKNGILLQKRLSDLICNYTISDEEINEEFACERRIAKYEKSLANKKIDILSSNNFTFFKATASLQTHSKSAVQATNQFDLSAKNEPCVTDTNTNMFIPNISLSYSNDNKNSLESEVNPEYWYQDEDIHTILQIKLENKNYRSVGDRLVQAYIPFSNLDKNENLLKAISWYDYKPGILLIPYNLGNLHWVGLVLEYNSNSKLIKAKYYDSLQGEVPNNLNQMLKNSNNNPFSMKFTKIIDPFLICQNNGNDCGPCTIQNLLASIGYHEPIGTSPLQRRVKHMQFLKENDLNFYQTFYLTQKNGGDLHNKFSSNLHFFPKKKDNFNPMSKKEYNDLLNIALQILNLSDKNIKQNFLNALEFDSKEEAKDVLDKIRTLFEQKVNNNSPDMLSIIKQLFYVDQNTKLLIDAHFKLTFEQLQSLSTILKLPKSDIEKNCKVNSDPNVPLNQSSTKLLKS